MVRTVRSTAGCVISLSPRFRMCCDELAESLQKLQAESLLHSRRVPVSPVCVSPAHHHRYHLLHRLLRPPIPFFTLFRPAIVTIALHLRRAGLYRAGLPPTPHNLTSLDHSLPPYPYLPSAYRTAFPSSAPPHHLLARRYQTTPAALCSHAACSPAIPYLALAFDRDSLLA